MMLEHLFTRIQILNMKNKNLFALIIFLFSFQRVIAQTNFTVSKSEVIYQKTSKPKMFFGCIGEKLYFIEGMTGTEGDNITVLDKDMKKLASEPLVSNNSNKQIIKPLLLWDKVYMLSLLNDKTAGKTSASLDEYDPNTLKYQNKNTEIFSSGYINYDADMGSYQANWLFTLSPDSSKIAFLFYHKESAYISVLDKDLKEVWKNTVKLDKNRISAKVSSLKLLNNGEIVLLFTQNKGSSALGIIDYSVYSITDKGNTVKTKEIPNDNAMYDCALYITKDSKPYLTGMYKKLGLQKPEGFFFNEIDMQTAGFAKENKYKITNPIWPEKLSKKQKAKATDEDFKKVKDLDKYRHKIEIIEVSPGEFYFLIEQYKRNHAASPNDVDYSYDNVYVCYVNMKTNKNWDQMLAKSVRTNMLDIMSYVSFHKNGDLYIFYNDCEQNLDKMKDTEINEYFLVKDCDLSVLYSKYNRDGFVEKKKFVEAGDNGLTRGFKALSEDGNSLFALFYGAEKIGKNWESFKMVWKISME